MWKISFLNVIAALSIVATITALPQKEAGFDYCNSTQTRCGKGSVNIGCNSPFWNGGWGRACRSPTFITLSPSVQQQIVDIHNSNRNKQALRQVDPHYQPAKLMATMTWDQNLANMAELHARNCTFAVDKCHNTKTWWLSGQNIYIFYRSNPWTDAAIQKQLLTMADEWFSTQWPNGQYYNWMDAVYGNYSRNPSAQNGKPIGAWTCVIQDINQAVGCAAVTFRSQQGSTDWYSLFLVCNYAFANLLGRSAYVPGTAASGCATKNSNYPGLCSVRSQKYYLDQKTPYP